MKSVNGILLMIVGVFLLWIGVTGRFPALIAAIGLVRGSIPNQSKTGAPSGATNSKDSGSTPSPVPSISLTPATQDWLKDTYASLNRSQSEIWNEAKTGGKGASVSW